VTLQVEFHPYGTAALDRLRALIEEHKGGDPARPVTVVVQRGTVGLGVRRALAAEVSASGRQGVANVAFVTLAALADSLGAARLVEEGRAPMTDVVARTAMRGALHGAGPLLGGARDHPSTIDALVTTSRELRGLDDEVLDRLAGRGPRAREVIAVIRSARRKSAGWFDEVDVLAAATGRCISTGIPDSIGPVVLYLPSTLTAPAAALVRALASRTPCTAVIGVTGDPVADGVSIGLAGALDPGAAPAWPEPLAVPRADQVISAPTADAEVLLVVRDLMRRCEEGTPPEHVAVVHSGAPQYVTLLHDTLRSAGIPFNGSGTRQLSATVAGRMLLGALALPENDWRRDDVVAWLATGPLTHRGRPIPATRWDVLSAEAGVVAGLGSWRRRLETRAGALRAEAGLGSEDGEGDDAPWRRARELEAERCLDLIRFLEGVADAVSQSPDSWKSWAQWAREVLRRLVGGANAFEDWPVVERAAAEEVEAALGRMSILDDLGVPVSLSLGRATLAAELEVPAPQTSRFGRGILVAPVGAVVGLSLDLLYVVGMNDGIFPARPPDDVLIPDHEREEAEPDGAVPLRGAKAAANRRDYLAALAGATTSVLSFPRGNQRDGRAMRPSRWLLDSLAVLAQWPSRLYSSELDSVPERERYQVAQSYIGAVAGPGAAMSMEDRDLRSLVHWDRDGHRMEEHWLAAAVPRLARGFAFVAGSRGGFTRFNGNLGGTGPTEELVPPMLSSSRLETFAQCPRKYFFESVLGVQPRPTSLQLLAVDRMDRGTLIHQILETFVRSQLELGDGGDEGGGDEGGGDEGGGAFGEQRLLQVAEAAMDEFEAAGLSGPRSVWALEKRRIRRDLSTFAEADRRWRHSLGATTVAVEWPFGFEGSDPVSMAVPNGQRVHFRGKIDRIDATHSGGRIVTDYKTGDPERFKKIEEDHFLGNRSVQLALYGLAVAGGDDPVRVEYWFVSQKGKFTRLGFDYTAADSLRLSELVSAYTGTMARGHFPANPGDPRQCGNCPYDSVCPADRRTAWARIRRAPELSPYVELIDP
jgi:ATP-dependent helicase/nuclease subunit B